MPADELQQLRDVHSPEPPGAWPPAPGWWLLVLLSLIALIVLARRLLRRRRKRAPYVAALIELDRIAAQPDSGNTQAQEIALLLRRMAMLAHPEAAALPAEQLPERLFGHKDDWLIGVLANRFAADPQADPEAEQQAAAPDLARHMRAVIERAMRQRTTRQ